ncbi:unnamed protein product [Peniophora sp. CBMAI 1063]|nr:unnamed protein product [Peniophora sp. CBMAI 1063]
MVSDNIDPTLARGLGLESGLLPRIRVEDLGVRRFAVVRGFEIGVMDKLDAVLSTWAIPGARVYELDDYPTAYRRFKEEFGIGNRVALLGTDTAESREVLISQLRASIMSAMPRAGESQPLAQVPPTHDGGPPSTPLSPRVQGGARGTARQVAHDLRTQRDDHSAGFMPSSPVSPLRAHLRRGESPVESPPRTPSPAEDAPPEVQPDHLAPWSSPAPTRPRFAPPGWAPPNAYTPPVHRGVNFRPAVPIIDQITHPGSKKAWYVAHKSRRPGIYKTWQDAKNASPGALPYAPGFMKYAEALAKWVEFREAGEIVVYQ